MAEKTDPLAKHRSMGVPPMTPRQKPEMIGSVAMATGETSVLRMGFARASTSNRRKAALRALFLFGALAAVFAPGCSSYRVTCQNPYPTKTTLENRHVQLREVVFPEAWLSQPHQRIRAERLAERLRSRFPAPADQREDVLFDIVVHSEQLMVESPDIRRAVATQGVWPTETRTRAAETVVLKFHDPDGKYLFEKRSRPLRITDQELNSILGLAWWRSAVRKDWHSEAGYLERRYEYLRDAVMNLLDAPDVLAACARAARAEPAIWVTPEEPVSGNFGPVAQRWAVIVGISQYRHAGVHELENLRYAHRDAEGIYNQLVADDPEHWPKENVLLLTDAAATRDGLNDAVFTFLKRAQKEDLVLLFFSGHGSLDLARPANSYFLCHDTDPQRLAATGFPVWEISNAFARGVIQARRMVILADACHSGGFAPPGVKDIRFVPGNVADGIALLGQEQGIRSVASSAAGQFSQESADWGGGHGAFAWALIEGLSGQADSATDKNSIGNADGWVDMDELAHYVRRRVGDLTANAQHVQDSGGLNVPLKRVAAPAPAAPAPERPCEAAPCEGNPSEFIPECPGE